MGTISFQFDPEKFIQIVAYLMSKVPGTMTRKRLLKLCYFADREHLLRYGRPVLKDYYVNMDQGPVASRSYDLIKGNHHTWSQEVLDEFAQYFSVRGMFITAIRADVATDLLSPSDIEVLNETVATYGRMNADHLSAISHRHRAWLASQRNKPIDYRLFFDGPDTTPGSPDNERMLELVEEGQPLRSLVSDVRPLSSSRTTRHRNSDLLPAVSRAH